MPQAFPSAGLIPAHAGKTKPSQPVDPQPRAHPRSRGENGRGVGRLGINEGSSPLTRGKLGSGVNDPEGPGLIPAHAGKTAYLAGISISVTAHPRSRGENRKPQNTLRGVRGSSPLTRGKRGVDGVSEGLVGLIPAHAGKTTPRRSPETSKKAHPRSRGENDALPGCTTGWEGSSPLTRGKRTARTMTRSWYGLIPAHAGKTVEAVSQAARCRAHPRSRGENRIGGGGGGVRAGSSPLTRGKPRRSDRLLQG